MPADFSGRTKHLALLLSIRKYKNKLSVENEKEVIPKPDYNSFYHQLREDSRRGIPTSIKDLVRLAEKYNCPIPQPTRPK